jgi:hypothetical protein
VRQKLLQTTKSESVKAEIKKQTKYEVDTPLPSSSSSKGMERPIQNGYSKGMNGNDGRINDNEREENYNVKQQNMRFNFYI